MGTSFSQEDYARSAYLVHKDMLNQPCLLPDVGIDESLLKYSEPDSNAVLQAYSNEMLNTVPGYVGSLGSAIAALNSVPNAVGLGALVISMIIEIAIKARTSQTSDNTYSLIRRVFGEEKASLVRDTMSEYLKRHEVFINNTQQLQLEIRRLDQQLSNHLTILRNSLLHDGQMSSRGFKIWVNGAAFHIQMLIHGARLQACKSGSGCVNEIKITIDLYLRHLDHLLEKYKTYKINSDVFILDPWWWRAIDGNEAPAYYKPCKMYNKEIDGCKINVDLVDPYFFPNPYPCDYGKEVMTVLMDIFYSTYEPIKGLKSYFLNIQNNLNFLIRERGSFTLPPAAG